MVRRERRLAPGRAWAGKLDELERTSGLLTPRRWLIWRARATRRQSQTKLCQSFMNRPKRGVEAVRTEVTRTAVNLAGDLWRRRKQRWSEFIHSKLTVRAGVLELGHGAWRHEMGMGDRDRRACSPPGARALVSGSAPGQLSLKRQALSAFQGPSSPSLSSSTARTGQTLGSAACENQSVRLHRFRRYVQRV